jgi:hypothetical protein
MVKINSNSIEDRMYFSLSGQEQDTTQRQMGKLTDTFVSVLFPHLGETAGNGLVLLFLLPDANTGA